jgi:hypothetical protein
VLCRLWAKTRTAPQRKAISLFLSKFLGMVSAVSSIDLSETIASCASIHCTNSPFSSPGRNASVGRVPSTGRDLSAHSRRVLAIFGGTKILHVAHGAALTIAAYLF